MKKRAARSGGVVLATAAIYVQILLGAVMRHTGAGLAIPDFPTFFGGLFPSVARARRARRSASTSPTASAPSSSLVLVARAPCARSRGCPGPVFAPLAAAWAGLVCLQVILGALSIWSAKAVAAHRRPPRRRRPLLGHGRPRRGRARRLPDSRRGKLAAAH